MATSLRELLDRAKAVPVPEVTLSGEIINDQLAHFPVVLMIDSSGSMEGEKIKAVNSALSKFFTEIASATVGATRTLRDQGDFAVIRYGNDVKTEVAWTHGSKLKPCPPFRAVGSTPMGAALFMAGELLLDQFRAYEREDTEVLCGAVFNLTDGAATDMDPNGIGTDKKTDPELLRMWNEAKELIRWFEEAGSTGYSYVQFFHLGVPGFNTEKLEALSAKPDRVFTIEADISGFFDFVKASLNGLGDYATVSEAVQARLYGMKRSDLG